MHDSKEVKSVLLLMTNDKIFLIEFWIYSWNHLQNLLWVQFSMKLFATVEQK